MEQAQGTSTTCNTRPGCAKRRNYFITHWIDTYPTALPHNATYMVTCDDICPTTGKKHGHAFIYFKNPVTMTAVKKLFGKDCHIEPFIRSNSQCIAYVKGEIHDDDHVKTNIHEYGTMPMDNGKHRLAEAIEQYSTVTELKDADPLLYCQYRQGIRDIMRSKQSKNRYWKPVKIVWIYGPTGTSKTRRPFEANARNVDYNHGFFTDWEDDRIISIEEMTGQIPWKTLLKLTDDYHNYYEVNIKGGSKVIDIDELYITSTLHPYECYPDHINSRHDNIDQLMRRIDELICTDPAYEYHIDELLE